MRGPAQHSGKLSEGHSSSAPPWSERRQPLHDACSLLVDEAGCRLLPRLHPNDSGALASASMPRDAVRRFCEAEGFSLSAEFVEAESGKGADALDRRPQLAKALSVARSRKCAVIVAKLDRLSRDVAFISGLMAQRVPFIVRIGPKAARSSTIFNLVNL